MRLFLSGGGSGEKSLQLDKKFAQAVDRSKPILYIPIAIDKERHPYPECLKWVKNAFSSFGITNFELWTEEDLRNRSEKELSRFGGVYIGGGNTFYLLNELRNSKFIPKLESMIRGNLPVYGGSAGAIILARTIVPALSADPNEVGMTDFNSFNFVNGHDIWCHYEPSMDKEIKDYTKKYKLSEVIALPENCGLEISDGKIEVVGPGSAYQFGKRVKEIKPGQVI